MLQTRRQQLHREADRIREIYSNRLRTWHVLVALEPHSIGIFIIMKILVVEDDANDVVLIERQLQSASLHYVLKQVDNLNELVKQLKAFAPDVVLADYTLPGFDGMAAL